MNKGIIILLGFFIVHVTLNWLLSESTLSLLIPYVLLSIIILFIHYYGIYPILQNLGFESLNIFRAILFGAMLFIVGGIGYFVTGLLDIEIYNQSQMGKPTVLLILIAITAAFLEELFFRGFLIQLLRRQFDGEVTIIFISSLLFSFFHLSKGQYISTFLLGIVLGYITLKHKNMSLTIGAHLIYNLIGLSLHFLSAKNTISNN